MASNFIIKVKQDPGTFTYNGKTYNTATEFQKFANGVPMKIYVSTKKNDISFSDIAKPGDYKLIGDFIVGGTGDLIFKNQDLTVNFSDYPSLLLAYKLKDDYSVAVKGWGKVINQTGTKAAGNEFIFVHKLFEDLINTENKDDELHLRFGVYQSISLYSWTAQEVYGDQSYTFDSGKATNGSPVSFTMPGTTTLTPPASKEFNGYWTREYSDYQPWGTVTFTMPAQDYNFIFAPSWKNIVYTFILELHSNDDNATFTQNNDSIYQLSETSTEMSYSFTNVPRPVFTGYTFEGWYTSSTDANNPDKTSSITDLTRTLSISNGTSVKETLYAGWKKNISRWCYNVDGSSRLDNTAFYPKRKFIGTYSIEIPTTNFNDKGPGDSSTTTWGGWTDADGSVVQKSIDYALIATDPIKLYSSWKVKPKLKITYDPGEGTFPSGTQTTYTTTATGQLDYTYSVQGKFTTLSHSIIAHLPTKTNYLFEGWSYNGSTYSYGDSISLTVTAAEAIKEITLTAIYGKKYNLTINYSGYTKSDTTGYLNSLASNASLALNNIPTPTHSGTQDYFKGWYDSNKSSYYYKIENNTKPSIPLNRYLNDSTRVVTVTLGEKWYYERYVKLDFVWEAPSDSTGEQQGDFPTDTTLTFAPNTTNDENKAETIDLSQYTTPTVKSGKYVFNGWSVSSGTLDGDKLKITTANSHHSAPLTITLKPTWKSGYLLKIDYQQGTLKGGDEIKTIPSGTQIIEDPVGTKTLQHTIPNTTPVTTKEYNIFTGYLGSDDKTYKPGNTVSVKFTEDGDRAKTFTLTAQWIPQYILEITYNKNAGSITNIQGSPPEKQTIKQNKGQQDMIDPTKFSVELKFGENSGLSHDEWEVAGWDEETSPETPKYTPNNPNYTYDFSKSPNTYKKQQTLYAFWEEAGYVWIYTSAGWKRAQPWIYCKKGSETTPSWHKARPWIFDGSEWKHT